MQVKDLMNRNVICVDQDASLQDAAKLLQRENVGTLCVTGSGLVGILTDRDITTKAVAKGWDPAQHQVNELMTHNPVSISPDADVLDATKMMAKHKIRRLPVCQDGQITGVISFADLASYTRQCFDNLITEETKAEK